MRPESIEDRRNMVCNIRDWIDDVGEEDVGKRKKQPSQGKKPRLWTGKSSLSTPMTPFEQRMSQISGRIPLPDWHPDAKRLKDSVIGMAEWDLAIRVKSKEIIQKTPYWIFSRMLSGSGLLMANTIRSLFDEYCRRIIQYGFHSLPMSFNVVESFLDFSKELFLFDIREEREHLLSIDDYFAWYKENEFPKGPAILMDIMEEGMVYSFNMIGDTAGSRIKMNETELVVAGVSLVRHRYELSCVLAAGETPPYPTDADIVSKVSHVARGKEKVIPDPSLGVADRFLEHLPGHARVFLLSRFDLLRDKYFVRSVHCDCGNSFLVLTDDFHSVEQGFAEGEFTDDYFEQWKKNTERSLGRYDSLFSTLASLIYLPMAFIAELRNVAEIEFKTEAFAKESEKDVREAVRLLGPGACKTSLVVRCLSRLMSSELPNETEIVPPEMEFESAGYWKVLPPGAIGEDIDGKPIVGRTWVTRTEMWSAGKPQKFLLARRSVPKRGDDPGFVYVMRSEAHALDVYKVGLTRRTTEKRAGELSSATGVPVPFGVLTQWEIGNCKAVEDEVHERLKAYRVNERREFFRIDLRTIIAVIDSIVKKVG
jgi:hypothetical protein